MTGRRGIGWLTDTNGLYFIVASVAPGANDTTVGVIVVESLREVGLP